MGRSDGVAATSGWHAQLLFSVLAVALAGLHMLTRYRLDSIALALVVLAVLPWLVPWIRANLRSVELPGAKIEFLERRIESQEAQIGRQQDVINRLVLYSMSYYIFQHLSGLLRAQQQPNGEYLFRKNDAFERDLRFLRDHGYLALFNVGELTDGENLARRLELTPAGKLYVQLRQEYEATAAAPAGA